MIDSSVLARRCAPEAATVELTVLIADLWKWTYEALESSLAQEGMIDRWARENYRAPGEMRNQYGLRSVVHEMLTSGLQLPMFVLRVHDGQRAWRLPVEAFHGWPDGFDLEMTWTSGRLWELDAADEFRAIAALCLPLLITEAEGDAFRGWVSQEIRELSAPPGRDSERRRMLVQQLNEAEEAVPEADAQQQGAWVSEWSTKARWPLREVFLWVALRDINEVAKTALTSFWAGNEDEGLAGPILARCDVDGQRDWRRVVESDPEARLMRALKGDLRAYGLYEGAGYMKLIEGVQWENLKFGVPPKVQRGRSDAWQSAAHVNDQIHGVAWRSHWTGIVVEREDLFAALPPIPVGEGEPHALRGAVDEKPPVRRAGEGTLEQRFKEWVWAELEQNCLPDLVQTFGFARLHGHTRKWARDRLKKLPPVLRLSNGMRRQRPEISDEQRAAYFAHFGPV